MVEFFRGMDPIDIFTCVLALVIVVGAIFDMLRIYIHMRRRK